MINQRTAKKRSEKRDNLKTFLGATFLKTPLWTNKHGLAILSICPFFPSPVEKNGMAPHLESFQDIG